MQLHRPIQLLRKQKINNKEENKMNFAKKIQVNDKQLDIEIKIKANTKGQTRDDSKKYFDILLDCITNGLLTEFYYSEIKIKK
jgi:hypothetical protein